MTFVVSQGISSLHIRTPPSPTKEHLRFNLAPPPKTPKVSFHPFTTEEVFSHKKGETLSPQHCPEINMKRISAPNSIETQTAGMWGAESEVEIVEAVNLMSRWVRHVFIWFVESSFQVVYEIRIPRKRTILITPKSYTPPSALNPNIPLQPSTLKVQE